MGSYLTAIEAKRCVDEAERYGTAAGAEATTGTTTASGEAAATAAASVVAGAPPVGGKVAAEKALSSKSSLKRKTNAGPDHVGSTGASGSVGIGESSADARRAKAAAQKAAQRASVKAGKAKGDGPASPRSPGQAKPVSEVLFLFPGCRFKHAS